MFRLRTLGGAAVLLDDRPVESIAGQRKLTALLALLAVAGPRGMSRDRIAAFLWPESDVERARGSLKQSLHVLRRHLGTADVVVGTAELRVNHERVASDVAEFTAAAGSGDHARAVSLYGGPFLDGFHLAGAPEFSQWVEEERAALARQHAQSLEALARGAQERGAFADAAALWRRLQAADPFSARAATGLMEALEGAGERAAALRAGRAYEALMREELATSADPAVTAMIQRLAMPPTLATSRTVGPHTGSTPPTSDSPPPGSAAPAEAGAVERPREDATRSSVSSPSSRWAPPPRLLYAVLVVLGAVGLAVWWLLAPRDDPGARPADASIAVIPFVNTSEDAADGHFADGLTDELISTLGRVEGMRVSARTSTFALKDRGLSARAFADTLGVAAVIEGTVRRQGDRLKVTAQLVDPGDNSVLWSESFDRRVEDMIAVQEEIARSIVRVLQGQLPARSPAVGAVRANVDPEAYDLYLRGRYNWESPARERLEQAVRYHQRAVERDPSFAAAYAGLAVAYVNMAIYGHVSPPEALAKANVAAERALALDQGLVEALAARAYVRLSGLEFAGAEADLRRALAVNPNFAWAHHYMSLHLMMVGRPQEAEQYNRQALVLDPLSLPANATRGIVQAQLGNLAAAERDLTRALQLRSDFTLSLAYLGALQIARGANDDALLTLQNAARQAPDYPGLPGALALVLRRLGRGAEADSILSLLERGAATDPRARVNLAFAHGAAGHTDAALTLLAGVSWDVPTLIGLRADPLLAGLRADPRCARILQSIGAQQVSWLDSELTGT